MADVMYTQFNEENLTFERNIYTTTDKQTGNPISTPQLVFNYVDPEAPVMNSMPADGTKRRARFVIQGPKMKTNPSNYKHPEGKYVRAGSLTYRENKISGVRSYSISQTYDLDNPEHMEWVKVNRDIKERLVTEWANKDVKTWSKHTVMRANLSSSVPSLIYQETEEDENGNAVLKEGSKPSSFFDCFEAITRDGKPFGTRVRIHGSRSDLPKEKWIKLLSENAIEYTPFISYQRSSLTGKDKFALKTQLDMIVIHEVTPFEGSSYAKTDKRTERLGVTAEDEARARRIEAMLAGDSTDKPSTPAASFQPSSSVEGTSSSDW
jgi:hypothetical protein